MTIDDAPLNYDEPLAPITPPEVIDLDRLEAAALAHALRLDGHHETAAALDSLLQRFPHPTIRLNPAWWSEDTRKLVAFHRARLGKRL